MQVSEVGLGGIPIQRLDEDEAIRVVQRCLGLGVNYIDTAHGYGNSEERIGKAIAGRRDGLIIATKSHGFDAATFRAEMEQSFQRLNVEHIDLFQFHWIRNQEQYDQVTAKGGALDIAREAQEAGRIGHIGVTSHNMDIAIKMVESGHFETMMFPFNFITREPADELIPACRKHDVGFIAMKPMAGGLLENATLAFKYLRQEPDVVPLVGIQDVGEIEEIATIVEGPTAFTVDEEAEVERMRGELGTRFCRACDYCQPCTQGIGISQMMRIRGFGKRTHPDSFFGDWGQPLVAKAETCVDCGDCEARCPYELPIREMMRENVAWYHEQMALYRAG